MIAKLSEKELQVFELTIKDKLSNSQIAEKLSVTRGYILLVKRNICKKLNVKRVTEYKENK